MSSGKAECLIIPDVMVHHGYSDAATKFGLLRTAGTVLGDQHVDLFCHGCCFKPLQWLQETSALQTSFPTSGASRVFEGALSVSSADEPSRRTALHRNGKRRLTRSGSMVARLFRQKQVCSPFYPADVPVRKGAELSA